jgi:hypothetical protein
MSEISIIPPVQPALPSETPHGGHGHSHSAKQVAAYQQAQAHHPARTNRSTPTPSPAASTHISRTDKDGEGHKQDAPNQDASHSTPNEHSGDECSSPAAIVSISAAARAAIVHPTGDPQPRSRT